MKKMLTALLTLALLLGLALPATAENRILDEGGLVVEALVWNVDDSGDAPHLTLHVRIVNDLDRKVWIGCDGTTIDGAPASHPGLNIEAHSDTGASKPQHLVFEADADDFTASCAAIRDPHTLQFTLLVEDYDTFERLYEVPVTIDLTALGKGTEPKPTPKPTISPATTSKTHSLLESDYTSLSKGSKGEAVKDLQERLIELGFLNDKADGSFGNRTAAAVRIFCDQNGLPVNSEATPAMQVKLYSSSAKHYSEPDFPLIIGSECYFDPITDVDTFFFKVQVMNTSCRRTIKGFELSCYTTDLWGKQLMGDGVKYTQSTKAMVGPGETVWSDSFNLGNWYSTDTVWVGIKRIVFDDGEILEVDDVRYYECLRLRKGN